VSAVELARAVVARDAGTLRTYGLWRCLAAVGVAGAMMVYSVGMVLLGMWGLVHLARHGRWRFAVWAVVFAGYFLGVAGPNAEARYRTSLLPLMLLCAAVGLIALRSMPGNRIRS
jgi:hypothetical protein